MIPFKKSLAFRLLAISFIVLALPLLVDSFVIIQRGYEDAINDAKGHLAEVAHRLEIPFEQLQPVKKPFFLLLERWLHLSTQFPDALEDTLNNTLQKMTEVGGFGGIFLLKLTPDKRYVITAASDPNYIGSDFSELFKLSSPKGPQSEFFNLLYYDPKTLLPTIALGKGVFPENKETPTGLIMVYQQIQEQLQDLLKVQKNKYAINMALLFPDSFVFAASDPTLQSQYFEALSKNVKDFLSKQGVPLNNVIPEKPIPISYDVGYPFFEFSWQNKQQIGYISPVPHADYKVLVYASKYGIHFAPFYVFTKVYITFFAILLFGGLLAYLITRRLAKPLRSLSNVMLNIQKGNLTSRYHNDGLGFEINLLGNIFNEMIDALLQKKHLAEEERIKREMITKELMIGQEVQRSLLPQSTEDYPGVEVGAVYIPAKNVGGDFYGVYALKDKEEIVLSIADAAGKGVQACFYSLGVRSLLQSFIREYDDVAEVMTEVNNLFRKDTRDSGMFITVLMGFYDKRNKVFSYYSCGHNPGLILRRKGNIEILHTRDVAMGVMPLKKTDADKIALETGDYVVFYTDGVTEAVNENFEQFGENRLMEYLKELNGKSATQVAEGLVSKVNEFTGRASQHDDITLLIMRIL